MHLHQTWFVSRQFSLTLAVGALAQEPAPLKLTLHDAVSLALKQNPQVILATLNTEQTQQDRSIARSGLLPQVNGRVQETVNRVNLESAIGFRFPGFAQHVGPYWVSQAGVGFNAPIFDLTLWRRYKASQYGIDASRAGEINAREESVLLVVSQYLGSQRAAADVKAAQSRVDLAQALYNQAADLQRNGVGTGIDTLRSNVALQNEKQRLIVSRTQLETSLFGLCRLLNLDPRQKVELADPVSFFETPCGQRGPIARERLEVAAGAASHPQRRAARRTRPARRRRPAPPQADRERLLGGAGADTRTPPSRSTSISGESTCRCLPAGASRRSAPKRRSPIRQLKQQEQDIRNRIALEVKTAVAQVASARSEVDVANLGVQLAQQQVEQSRDRFQAGVTNNVEVIQAQDELARANDNQIAALYRYNQSRADLAHSVGQMETLYAK